MKPVKLDEILDFLYEQNIAFSYKGKKEITVDGFSSLKNYKDKTITWIKNGQLALPDNIELAIVQEEVETSVKNQIICQYSKAAFFSLVEHFFADNACKRNIGDNTFVSENVIIGKNVIIGNNCSIDGNITIGEGTIIGDNVVIRNKVSIGKRCCIQSLSVIGEDGFGYYEDDNHKKRMVKHYGGVIIGNDVFIGSHVNIARGTIDDTQIADGVKIAPSTHIGHNNLIGQDATIICSQLYGSVTLGDNSYVVGSIVRNQCNIGNNTMVGMGSIVTKNIEDGKVAIGMPAKVIRDNI